MFQKTQFAARLEDAPDLTQSRRYIAHRTPYKRRNDSIEAFIWKGQRFDVSLAQIDIPAKLFRALRQRADPLNRLRNSYFAYLLG